MNRTPKHRIAYALLLCAALSLAVSGKAAAVEAHYTTGSLSVQERDAGNLLNSDRRAYNLPALAIDPTLSSIARIKSQDMLAGGYFAHISPTYGDVRDMLTHFGYPYTAAGENIARYATIEKAQAALMSSPGHRRNILSSAYTKVGVGIALSAKGHVYLTQIFCR